MVLGDKSLWRHDWDPSSCGSKLTKRGLEGLSLFILTWCMLGRQLNWEPWQEELIDGVLLLMRESEVPMGWGN